MNIDPEKKASLLAPLADAYAPTRARADRLFAKLQSSIEQDLDNAPSSSASGPAGVGRAIATWEGKHILFVGLSCFALALGGAFIVREQQAAPAVAPTTKTTEQPSTASRPLEGPGEGEGAAEVPSFSVHALPTVGGVAPTDKVVKKAPARPFSPPPEHAPSSSDTLEREARLLADVRRALKNGDDAGALALLDEHARVFPHGWLASERAVERIVVLCSLGRRADAVREATVFLDGRPRGPLTRRVEMSCAGQPTGKVGE